jgi:hypothetical protein
MPDLSPKERKDLLDPLKELQLVYKTYGCSASRNNDGDERLAYTPGSYS